MDYFRTMQAFVEVVKKGSYTGAAKSLGSSRALLSRRILDLEEQVGQRLLNRTTRSITLTDSGQQYFVFCERVINEIVEKEKELSGRDHEPEGNLSIVSPKWIGNFEIADAAAAFALQYPAINLKLMLGGMASTAYDFLEQGYDIALHTRPIPDSQIRAKRIATINFVLCGAPSYLEKMPPISRPVDLAAQRGLIQENSPVWRLDVGGDSVRVRVKQVFSSNTYLVLRKACLKGLGLAILPQSLVAADLKRGDLVHILPDCPIEPRPLYAAFAPGSMTPMKVRLFIDFLAGWFRDHPL